ncbi:hypothetical protein OLQ14_05480 [Campylobacter jejuni]|nr:hypothetical protein [Campylobacter jejuni]
MKKSLIYLIVLCLSYTAMQAVCKYAEEQREDRAVPIATLIRLGMGYMVSRMQMHQMLEDKHTQKDRLLRDVIDS